MSKFDVTVINPKNPMGEKVVELANKRLNELRPDQYKAMFEAENCDNPDHDEHQNKVTINIADKTMDLDCCCMSFEDKLRKRFGGK